MKTARIAHRRHPELRGFTLVELLVALAVVGVLSGLLLAALGRGSHLARRVACGGNLRQLAVASLLYADDDAGQSLSGKQFSEDQNLNWLLPTAGDPRVFVCPATRNQIREEVGAAPLTGERGRRDLFTLAPGTGRVPGMSYQGLGFAGYQVGTWETIAVAGGTRTMNGIRKSLANIQSYAKYHDAFGLKGTHPGPAGFWLLTDAAIRGTLYFPDATDNHGADGANTAFCDGHVAWIPARRYIRDYELSQDEGRTGLALPWQP